MVKSDYVKSEISLISRFSSITLLYQLLFLWWCVHPSDDPLWHQQLWSREVSDVKANHLCLKFIVSRKSLPWDVRNCFLLGLGACWGCRAFTIQGISGSQAKTGQAAVADHGTPVKPRYNQLGSRHRQPWDPALPGQCKAWCLPLVMGKILFMGLHRGVVGLPGGSVRPSTPQPYPRYGGWLRAHTEAELSVPILGKDVRIQCQDFVSSACFALKRKVKSWVKAENLCFQMLCLLYFWGRPVPVLESSHFAVWSWWTGEVAQVRQVLLLRSFLLVWSLSGVAGWKTWKSILLACVLSLYAMSFVSIWNHFDIW